MAARKVHPERTLLIFLLVTLGLIGGMAALKTWTPRLGLDLRGGTTVTLTAQNSTGGGAVDQASMTLARDIIQRRIDGLGVGETSVTLSGDRDIIIAVPQMNQDQLLNMVGKTAQLAFRQVITATPVEDPTATASTDPTADPSASPSATATGEPSASPAASAQPSTSPTAAASGNAAATPSATQTGERRPAPQLPTAPPAPATPRPTTAGPTPLTIEQAMAYQPTQQDADDFVAYKCGDPFPDVADQPLITCDKDGQLKYFLSPTLIKGDVLKDATAGIPQNAINWQVNLAFKPEGAEQFGQATTALATQQSPMNQFAIVLDGDVISAPQVTTPILGGEAQITGNFNQKTASELANVLKYGALPLNFDVSSVDNISPTLGNDQLRAGIIAGLIGLLLVVAYAFLYYRALGVVVVLSLAVAALLTWILMVLLGAGFDLALSLPGIAGAIVAIGVTADSFIIYFERIRDEVREGRSLRTAIETGWQKARGTIVIADAVSLLSALVLFILAIGAVKGFAFTLGLTTLIDLAMVFFFTKPLMTLLGRTKFFGEGHKWSGLDPEHMGVDRVTAVRTRRTAGATSASRTREGRAGEDTAEPTGLADEIEEA